MSAPEIAQVITSVPPGSIVVINEDSGEMDMGEAMDHLARAFGHKDFVLVVLPDGGSLEVISRDDAVTLLHQIVNRGS